MRVSDLSEDIFLFVILKSHIIYNIYIYIYKSKKVTQYKILDGESNL